MPANRPPRAAHRRHGCAKRRRLASTACGTPQRKPALRISRRLPPKIDGVPHFRQPGLPVAERKRFRDRATLHRYREGRRYCGGCSCNPDASQTSGRALPLRFPLPRVPRCRHSVRRAPGRYGRFCMRTAACPSAVLPAGCTRRPRSTDCGSCRTGFRCCKKPPSPVLDLRPMPWPEYRHPYKPPVPYSQQWMGVFYKSPLHAAGQAGGSVGMTEVSA